MAKRNCVVVLSSDDEDASNVRSLSSSRNYKNTNSKSTLASSRGRKRARRSASRSHLSKLHEVSIWTGSHCAYLFIFFINLMSSFLLQIDLFEDDFNEVFTGSKVSAGMLLLLLCLKQFFFGIFVCFNMMLSISYEVS